MQIDSDLYQALIKLRDRLKYQGRVTAGRAPTVCTDEVLFEIARLKPQVKEEFFCINGLGKAFVDQYADQFIKVIIKYNQLNGVQNQSIEPSTRQTLKELEKKLVNINRRNRLLYLAKITNKFSYDLYDEENRYNPLHILYSGKTVKICDVKTISNVKGQSGLEKYKRLIALIREVNKDFKDKGQFDMYIAYPFVSGRLLGENFDVRAPLALFPVEIIKETDSISIHIDENKDVIYNSNLILAHYKFNEIIRPIPNCVIDDISESSFLKNLIEFYKNEGIKIVDNSREFKFKDYSAGEFPQYQNGELHLEKNMVLGKFPIYASSLQKDFDKILEENIITPILSELLATLEDIDYYTDSYSGENTKEDEDVILSISEHDLTYIGDLNSSQENVLTAIKKQDALVVQGPPGTGKSQTITSLISDFVNEGHNVLMVSEKKAALDVVYSRLGENNRFALLIDDLNNKQEFYEQMETLIGIKHLKNDNLQQISETADTIDAYVRKLEVVAEKLYSSNHFGIEIYKLYLMNKRYDLSKQEEAEKYKRFKSFLENENFIIQFRELEEIKNKFSKETLLITINNYIDITTQAEWIKLISDNLSDYELFELKEQAKNISAQIETWQSKRIFEKIFNRGKLVKKVEDFMDKYFTDYDKHDFRHFLSDNFEPSILERYYEYEGSKPVYNALSKNEKIYFSIVLKVSNYMHCDLKEANKELFNFLICDLLFRFEAENREIFHSINNFEDIISILSEEISKKKVLTKKHLENVLWENLGNILDSKRQGEIARVIESKRKWSVNKFINKFSFEMFRGVRIWLLTPEVASEILPLQTGLFDLVIFDEASQMYVEKGIPSIMRAKKVVIAGDSKQLRPSNLGAGRVESIDSEDDLPEDYEGNAALEEESLLDLARFKYSPPVTLNFHYRSKSEELIAFSNYAFYKGGLYISPNVKISEKPPIEVLKVKEGRWINRSNICEAKKVIELLKEIFKMRTGNETIGIITFNSFQRDLIDDLIDEESARDQEFSASIKSEINRKDNGEDVSLFVKNIENVQGDERDIIIFSIGYAKNETGRLVTRFGWLNQKGGENRLNVAISRAKNKIYIVTSFEPSELHVEGSLNDGPKYLKKYLEYCFAVSNNDKESAKQVLLSFSDAENNNKNITFDSDFENQVYDALKEKDLDVETQIGIGGYSIDLAIKHNGKYILGIECDGKLYHSSKSARERDFHRQKYLESRGWTIHRIWSTNWWKNPEMEIMKIVEMVGVLI